MNSDFMGRSTPLPQFLLEQLNTWPIQCRHIEHMHKGVWFRKNIDKITAVITKRIFVPNRAFIYA